MAERKRGFFGRLVRLGFVAGAAYAVWRAIEANRADQRTTWDPQPFPFPPQPRTDAAPEDPPEDPPEDRPDRPEKG